MDEIIEESLQNSISYVDYYDLMQTYAKDGKTTGQQKEDWIYFTKLNAQRSRRITKTSQLNRNLVTAIERIGEKQTWLLITESWCGDAANSVPIIAKVAELNSNIELRLVLRDESPELMDQFLTNGGRSIPKLVVLNEESDVLFTWGPRPKVGQELYDGWRNSKNKIPYMEFQVELQKWYNQDAGSSIQEELLDLVLREKNMEGRTSA